MIINVTHVYLFMHFFGFHYFMSYQKLQRVVISTLVYMLPDVDDCDASPCQNGATCVDEHGGYTCQCTEQWLEENCTGILNTNIKRLQL